MKCHSKFELDIIKLFNEEYVWAEMRGIKLYFAGHIPEEAFDIAKNQNSTMNYFGQNMLFFISFPSLETKQGIVFTTEGLAWKVVDGNSLKTYEGGIQYFSLAIQGGRNYSRVPAILPIKIIYRCMKEYTADLKEYTAYLNDEDDEYPEEDFILEKYYFHNDI